MSVPPSATLDAAAPALLPKLSSSIPLPNMVNHHSHWVVLICRSVPMQIGRTVLPMGSFRRTTARRQRRKLPMPNAKRASKGKRRSQAVPVLGLAGVSLMAGGASASTTGAVADVPLQKTVPPQVITLGEEEISDVSLATFYVLDKENTGKLQLGEQLAWRGCRCGGCRCGGCRRCAVVRACGGCGGCGCCWSWGRCRVC